MRQEKESFKTLGEFFLRSCDKYAQRTAYTYRPRFRTLRWTYRDIKLYAYTFAELFGKYGVQKNDRVMIAATNSPYWVTAFFGTQLRGAVAVPLSPESKTEFLTTIAKDTQAKVLCRNEFGLAERLPVPDIVIEKVSPRGGRSETTPPTPLTENDLAEIVYTSGTTGNPKGVMLSHKNILSTVEASRQALPVDSSLRFVSILPLFHMFEQVGGMLVPLVAGAQVSYAASLNMNRLRWIFQEDKPNRMLAVPEFLLLVSVRLWESARQEGKAQFLDLMLRVSRYLPMSLRTRLFDNIHRTFGWEMHSIASGGAPLDPEVGAFWEGIGVYVLQGYGLTETSPVLTVNRYDDRKLDSVGKPVTGVSIRIAPDGEVLAKGPNVFCGYWRDEQKTAEAFDKDGWFKTGDIGEFDRHGHLHLKGRKKLMIVLASGEKVHPEDIERQLNREEGVRDSAVIGVKGPRGEFPHAVLLLDSQTKRQAKDIVEETNKRLSQHEQIRSFSVWKEADFPRTPTQKVKRHEVKVAIAAQFREGIASTFAKKRRESDRSPVEVLIAKILQVPLAKVSDEKRLVEDLGLDSLKRVELVGHMEAHMNVSVDEGEIGQGITVKELKELVERRVTKQVRYPFKSWHFTPHAALLRGVIFPLFAIPFLRLFTSMRVQGKERLAHTLFPVIFYANHLSAIDGAVIFAALPSWARNRLGALAATDVIYEERTWWIARFRGILEFLFALVPLARQGGQIKSSLEYAGRVLDHGYSLLMFPEGQISRTRTLLPFKQGAGFLGVEAHVPLCPVKLDGTADVLAPGPAGRPPIWEWPKRAKVRVTFGEPFVLPEGISYEAATVQMEHRLRTL